MFNRFGGMGAIMVLAGILTGLILATAVTCFMPKWYESTCMVEMMPQLDWGNPTKLLTADLETLKSRHFLSKVVLHLGLTDRWGMDSDCCVQALDQTVRVGFVRESDIVSLRVRHQNPVEAREIAEGVIRQYNRCINEQLKTEMEGPIKELREYVGELEAQTNRKRETLAEMLKLHGDIKREREETRRANAEYEEQLENLRSARLKLIEVEIRFKTDIAAWVPLAPPTLPRTPVSPNLWLNLLLGSAVGGVLFPTAAIPLLLRHNRKHK